MQGNHTKTLHEAGSLGLQPCHTRSAGLCILRNSTRFIELVGSIDPTRTSELEVQHAIQTHASRELLQPFDAIKARIPALVRDVELANHLLHVFMSDLKQENTVRTYRTGYVAVSKHRALPVCDTEGVEPARLLWSLRTPAIRQVRTLAGDCRPSVVESGAAHTRTIFSTTRQKGDCLSEKTASACVN